MDLAVDLDAVEGRGEPGVVIGAVRTTFLRMVAELVGPVRYNYLLIN